MESRPISFVTSKQCIPVKNTSDWIAVMFHACDIIPLFSVSLELFL